MNALKFAGICLAQFVLGPCAGPLGLASMVFCTLAAFVTFTRPVSVVFLAVVAGHLAGLQLCAVYLYFKRRREVNLK